MHKFVCLILLGFVCLFSIFAVTGVAIVFVAGVDLDPNMKNKP